MQVPLEISFHHVESSKWAEDEIRARVAKLEKIYHRLRSCRVRIERRAKTSMQSAPPVVRIELGIPGYKELVVTHEPDYLQQKYQAPDLHNAIHAAFRVAEDQLAELKTRRQDRSKQVLHDTENQCLGHIAEVNADADFGFILTKEGGLLHFHRDNLLSGDFDTLERGTAIYYVEGSGDSGPTATKVRVKNRE